MKVLDVANLTDGINQLNKTIENKQRSIENVLGDIKVVTELDTFTGEGAEAIKNFYGEYHLPFLKKLQMTYDDYKVLLASCQSSLKSFEGSPQGRIVEPFLSNVVYNNLEYLQSCTAAMVNEGNDIISSVGDIVSLPKLDDTELVSSTSKAKSFLDNTLTNLHAFDREQTTVFEELIERLYCLNNYILEIDSLFRKGELSIQSSSVQLRDLNSHFHLETLFDNRMDTYRFHVIRQQMNFSHLYTELGIDYVANLNKVNLEDREDESEVKEEVKADAKKEDITFITGNKEELEQFSFYGGVGKYKNDWELDLKKQVGGGSSFSLIGTTVKHDTDVFDISFEQDILKGEVKAGIGGENVFPIAKAQAVAYNVKARAEVDKSSWLDGLGGEATGTLGSATAYAGVDNYSVGLAAKTALAEGELSGFIKIPFTEYNLKGTIGGSVGGLGGEFKVGKETQIDLRALLGVKVGLSLEKDE